MRGSDRELGSDLDRLLEKARLGAELFGGAREPIRLGRFEVTRRLGRGAMGSVYEARDPQHGGLVALKLLTHVDPSGVYRIKREFRSLAQLSHPNLLVMHELFNEGDSWFFSMELVDGVPWDDWVRPDGAALDEARLWPALAQLVHAVHGLHLAGKLHCDLKPRNVLVTPAGRVVVLDFGLVKEHGLRAESPVEEPITGTPGYISPEQTAGLPPTPASDWYAVGVMLFGALSGRLPFEGDARAVLGAKQERDAPDPGELCAARFAELAGLCRALLRRDPQARAGAEAALSLVSPAQAISRTARPPLPAVPPFVGRAGELARLHAALEDAGAGQTRMVLLGGRSGVGKSALLERFGREIEDGALVLNGRCHERESLPYKVFDSVVHALGKHLRALPAAEVEALLPPGVSSLLRLFPELGRVAALAGAAVEPARAVDARQLRNQAFAALRDLLQRLTERTPVVLLVDDLQWGDIDSARMLSHVLGPSDAPPLLFLGAYRSEERASSEFLQALTEDQPLRAGMPELVELDPLPQAAALELVQVLLSSEGLRGDAELAAALAAEAEGLPFFIGELVQHWKAQQGSLRARAAQPITLEQALAERVTALPDAAQRLLRVLSVASGPIEQAVALEAADLPSTEQATLQRLRGLRLARSRGGSPNDPAETYHDRVRESVLRALPEAALRDVHARVAAALERRGLLDPDRLAVHHLGAGDRSKAAHSLEQAAHAAAGKLAFNHAAELFQRAIELTDQSAQKQALARPLADALANAGRGAQAARAYLEAAAALPPREARKLELTAAQQYLRAGHMSPGIPLAARLLAECGIRYPAGPLALLGLLIERARVSVARIEAPRSRLCPPPELEERLETLSAVSRELGSVGSLPGILLQTQYVREALRHGDDLHRLRGLAIETVFTALLGGERKRIRIDALLAATDQLAARIGTPHATATAAFARGASALCIGEPQRAEALTGQAVHTFLTECQGAHWDVAYARTWRYGAVELGGDLSILLREGPEDERDARERNDEYGIASAMLVVPQAYMMQDDPAAALRHLSAHAARLSSDFNSFHLWVMDRTTDALLYQREGRRAWSYLQSMWPRFSRAAFSRAPLLRVNAYFLLGRTAIAALGEQPGHRAFAAAGRKALSVLRRHQRPDAAGYAALVEAGLARRRGEIATARAALERAQQTFSAAGLRNFALYAQYNLGTLLHDERGQAHSAEAGAALVAMGVRNVPRWVAAYAPGFERDA